MVYIVTRIRALNTQHCTLLYAAPAANTAAEPPHLRLTEEYSPLSRLFTRSREFIPPYQRRTGAALRILPHSLLPLIEYDRKRSEVGMPPVPVPRPEMLVIVRHFIPVCGRIIYIITTLGTVRPAYHRTDRSFSPFDLSRNSTLSKTAFICTVAFGQSDKSAQRKLYYERTARLLALVAPLGSKHAVHTRKIAISKTVKILRFIICPDHTKSQRKHLCIFIISYRGRLFNRQPLFYPYSNVRTERGAPLLRRAPCLKLTPYAETECNTSSA